MMLKIIGYKDSHILKVSPTSYLLIMKKNNIIKTKVSITSNRTHKNNVSSYRKYTIPPMTMMYSYKNI